MTPSARTGPAAAGPGPRLQPHGAVLGPFGLFSVLLGAALPLVDFFIVNVALPDMGRDLGASEAMLELVVAGYGVAYAVLLVLGGRLGDLFGRRRLFLWGMAAFGVTSLLCGLAPGAGTLVLARIAQGAAAALMLPQVLATIQATTTGPRRARAMSLYGATAGLSMVAGQILGGVLVTADVAGLGWRTVFLVNVPVVVLGLLSAGRALPETRAAAPAPVDRAGTGLLALTLVTLLLPLTEGRAAGWPLWTWLLLGVFPFALAAFVAVERAKETRGGVPLVPPGLLRLPSMRHGLPLLLAFCAGFGGFMFVAAIALQEGLRLSPVAAGAALAPMAVAFFAGALAGPRLVRRWGGRVVTAGALIQGAGLTILAVTVLSGWPDLDVWRLAPGTVLAGFGQSLQLPVLLRSILADVPPERAGVGGGVMSTTQQTFMSLGVATLGTLFLALTPHLGTGHAFATTLFVQLGLVALMAAASLRLPRRLD
ncbi:MFS transporter [Streptomyces sp. SPB074]|uniref:MFS transporter n=1 Tax=Streptomyces sp. (strain SPB074) TaxID=465543 RepID=UPI00017FEBC3|nr:MFS transporter [Streptomyces sp. SPB074]EDY44577.1 actinorhodin transporter [Streptomyces sp. SPB074]